LSGSQTISAPVELESNLVVLPAAGSQLTLSGGISGVGQSLTVNDQGTVVLTGADSYSGGTDVVAGTLIATNSSAIAFGTSLTVGAGTPAFASPDASPSAAAAVAAPATVNSTPAASNSTSSAVSALFTSASSAAPAATASATPVPATMAPNDIPAATSEVRGLVADHAYIAPGAAKPYAFSNVSVAAPSRAPAVDRFVSPVVA